MPVDPFLQPLLDDIPDLVEDVDYATYRPQVNKDSDALCAIMAEPGPAIGERRLERLAVEGGVIDMFIYRPATAGPHPAHLFLHGGGWTLGTIRQAFIEVTCRERCAGANCVVLSVDYRKAPEHKFPTGLNDCYAALLWLAEHAAELGVNHDLITIGGQSAGGNLAAALALKVRAEGGPRLALQLLEVPALDFTFSQPSATDLGSGYGLTLQSLEKMKRDYLTTPDEAYNPFVSPLLAPNLSGLPPAHIMTAEYDPLRDDGAAYARRLDEAGVPVTYNMFAGQIHGAASFTRRMESARAWRAEVIATLQAAQAHGAAKLTASPA